MSKELREFGTRLAQSLRERAARVARHGLYDDEHDRRRNDAVSDALEAVASDIESSLEPLVELEPPGEGPSLYDAFKAGHGMAASERELPVTFAHWLESWRGR